MRATAAHLLTAPQAPPRATSSHSDGNGLDRVAAVAEAVPFGLLGLERPARSVARARTVRRAGLVEVREQLPPLPAVAAALADQPGRLPRTVADAHVDAGDRGRAGPRDTADWRGRRRRRRPRRVGSVISDRTRCRRTGSRDGRRRRAATRRRSARSGRTPRSGAPIDLDLGQPLHRRHRVPAGDDQPQRVAVLDRQRVAVHGVGEQRLGAARVVDRQAALERDRVGRDPSTGPRSAPRNTTSHGVRRSAPPGRGPRRGARPSTPPCSPRRAATARRRRGGSNSERPLPAHSSVATSVCDRMCCRSRRLRRSGRSTSPPHLQPPASPGRATGSRSGCGHRSARWASRRRRSARGSTSRS